MLVFYQNLQFSMEHHEGVRINAPTHSEACFCFWLRLGCAEALSVVSPVLYPASPELYR